MFTKLIVTNKSQPFQIILGSLLISWAWGRTKRVEKKCHTIYVCPNWGIQYDVKSGTTKILPIFTSISHDIYQSGVAITLVYPVYPKQETLISLSKERPSDHPLWNLQEITFDIVEKADRRKGSSNLRLPESKNSYWDISISIKFYKYVNFILNRYI